MNRLLQNIKECEICSENLPFGPRPVLSAHKSARIVIIGQAPGSVVHKSGIPWDDKSGDNLRNWMGIGKDTFYDEKKVALIPMGFCYPGKGKSGDLPPRPECAPLWHEQLMSELVNVELIVLIGTYAQQYYLHRRLKENLTQTVKSYKEYLPKYFVLPHPSPRNNIWQAKNEWFKAEVLPEFRLRIQDLIG